MASLMAQPVNLAHSSTHRSPVAASSSLLRSSVHLRAPFVSAPRSQRAGKHVATQAKKFDFDEVLQGLSEKFDKSDNKPIVVAYSVAAVIGFIVIERVINAPVLNIILGWPLQLLGTLMAPYLAVRYLSDGEDWYADASDAADRVTKQLPGLKK